MGRRFTAWESARPAYMRFSISGPQLKIQYVDARNHAILDTSAIIKGPPVCLQDSPTAPVATNSIFISIDGLHQGDLD